MSSTLSNYAHNYNSSMSFKNNESHIDARLMQDSEVIESAAKPSREHVKRNYDNIYPDDIMNKINKKKKMKKSSATGRVTLCFMQMISCFESFEHYNITIMLMNLTSFILYMILLMDEK